MVRRLDALSGLPNATSDHETYGAVAWQAVRRGLSTLAGTIRVPAWGDLDDGMQLIINAAVSGAIMEYMRDNEQDRSARMLRGNRI